MTVDNVCICQNKYIIVSRYILVEKSILHFFPRNDHYFPWNKITKIVHFQIAAEK